MAKNHDKSNVTSALFLNKKYRGILAIVSAFFALMIIVSLLTTYYTNKIEAAITESGLIKQQQLLQSEIAANILDVDLYLQNALAQKASVDNTIAVADLPQEALNLLDGIETKKRILTEIVAASDLDGDTVVLEDGSKVTIDGFQSQYLHDYVKNIDTLWVPYKGLVETFLKDKKSGQLSKENSEYLVAYARAYTPKLSFDIKNLDNGIAFFIKQQSNKILAVQTIGSIIGFILLLMLIFGALRQLVGNDRLLDAARRETTEIMTTVNTGLFLLGKDLTIGNQYSNALEGIMGTKRLAGENLTTVLRSRISDKDLDTTRQFVEQLYNPRVKENLINDLNPLHKIMFRDEQSSQNRYLDFKFSRVYEGKDIIRILVNVNDVSEAVLLEQRLEKERAQNDLQIEMLTTILNVHPRVIKEFINNTLARINKINDVLKNPGSSQFELEGKLNAIYREMHSLKGEASALKLHNFTKIASESEDKMQALQNKGQLVGTDFLPLAVHLDELLTLANTISKLGERINSNSGAVKEQQAPIAPVLNSQNEVPSASTYSDFYKSFAKEIASRQHKQVHVDVDESQFDQVPAYLSSIVKEMSIQLLRNAIVHGIESSEQRTAHGKNTLGLINMSVIKEGQNLVLTVKDDGKGIDYTAIRLQLVAKGLYTAEQARDMSEAQLLQQLFTSGFSTKFEVDEDGGRGVGLDIIKERLTEFKGQIDVKSKLNQGTQFVITLPL